MLQQARPAVEMARGRNSRSLATSHEDPVLRPRAISLGESASKLERVAKVACGSDGDLVNHLNISIYMRNK